MRSALFILALGTILTAIGACQFGGPPPTPGTAAGAADGGDALDGADAPGGAETTGADASVNVDTGAPDQGPAGGDGGLGGDQETTPAACVPPFVSEACDPVCNTGCPTLSRCDVGPAPAQGVCIGIWIGGEGSLCVRTPTTDPCLPRLSCLEGRCRRLCYVNSDCLGDGCCNVQVPAGGRASGYMACGSCDP
jgi:hypothetical protein